MTTLDQEPHPPTLGTMQSWAEMRQRAEGRTGLAYIIAKLEELNSRYCWTPGLRNKDKTNWDQVNRHLWRIKAMYQGGDCYLASFPGSLPHQQLWTSKACFSSHLAEAYPQLARLNTTMFKGKRMSSYTCTIAGYRQPKADPDNYNPDEWDLDKWSKPMSE